MRTISAFLIAAAAWPLPAQDQPLTPREQMLLEEIHKLEARVAALEARANAGPAEPSPDVPQKAAVAPAAQPPAPAPPAADSDPLRVLRGTTINLMLHAYDVLSNSFSLNQATMVIERAPDLQAGRRFGVRVDLQYGQATETLQGNPANEPRPQVYRPIFQAYGTYIVPLGSGLTVDFGKWASSLGIENNYAKDQMNYSRSYLFNFLPFYHFGARASYNLSSKLNVSYWLVNGVQQSEDFNGNKSQAVLLNIKPAKSVSWNVNYFTGVENRDTQQVVYPGVPELPTQPGLSSLPLQTPGRRLHILDTYATWSVSTRLTLAGEADYVVHDFAGAPAARVSAGAAYLRYQFSRRFAMAQRAEYLSDRGGLFSGVTQALKETTFTMDYQPVEGFLVRGEWRRDFSNRPFFLTSSPGLLKKEQNTATLGLIWWFGGKEGAW